MLGIPTVLDRMIQQALLQVLTPIFDPTFSDCELRLPSGTERARSGELVASISRRAIGGWWTWTWRSSSTESTTTC